MSEDNVINLADRRPKPELTLVEPMVGFEQTHETKVTADVWKGFSPETKSDALTNDLVSSTLIALDKVAKIHGIEIEDDEVMKIYDAVYKITDRIFGVEKGDSDGE